MQKHWTIFSSNTSNKSDFIASLLKKNESTIFQFSKKSDIQLFSKATIQKLIDEEEIHDKKIITKHTSQSLKSMSSGEQKRVLLTHLLNLKPDFLILDNPFDNLDLEFQEKLRQILLQLAKQTSLLLIISRKEDALPINTAIYKLENSSLVAFTSITEYNNHLKYKIAVKSLKIPVNQKAIDYKNTELIKFKNVSVHFEDHKVLQNINWTINKGDFWQLLGKNGSGKTTLLSMLIGENSKGYGQELYLFGKLKGSGESIWDIKKKIGYFTPTITENFKGNHSLENMIIAGLNDSIGLYTKPTETQIKIATEWLQLTNLLPLKDKHFCDVSLGQQRLTMLVRALIKQPIVLILDEPTAGLDDESAALFVALVNTIASQKQTAIVFVSHRREPNLNPLGIFELCITENGSIGKIKA